jgi:hypothetical protein
MKNLCVLNVLYELPDDDCLGCETRSNVGCHLLNCMCLTCCTAIIQSDMCKQYLAHECNVLFKCQQTPSGNQRQEHLLLAANTWFVLLNAEAPDSLSTSPRY